MENYKTVENGNTILFGDISASATSMSCTAGEGALFPTTFPFLLTLEKYSGVFVIKREVVKVTNRVDDLFTIERAAVACVQDDTAEPKVMSSNGLTFASGDSITNAVYAENDKDIKAELALKSNTTDVILQTGNQTIDGELTVTKIKGDGSELTGLSASVSSASLELMMSVNGTAGTAFSKADYEQLVSSTDVNLGTTTQTQIAQSFYGQLTYTGNVIPLMVKTVGTPDDGVYLEIQTDNAGEPSGTVVTNGTSDTIDYTNIAASYEEENFTFSGGTVALTVGTLYHFVLKRTSSASDVNYYAFGSAGTDALFGNVSLYNGSAWSTDTNDLYFKLPGYKLATLGGTNFIGILQADTNIGETGKFNTGYDNNQTNLIEGVGYKYNLITGAIEIGGNLIAISEAELVYDISYRDTSFGNGSDGNLVVANGETYNLSAGKIYQFNNITVESGGTISSNEIGDFTLKCNGIFILDGDINLNGQGSGGSISFNGTTVSAGTAGTAGDGGRGGYNYQGNYAGVGGIGADGFGGGGGGGSTGFSARGGDGGGGAMPGGLGGNGGAQAGDGGDAYGTVGGNSATVTSTGSGSDGGNSAGGGGGADYGSSSARGGGGGGGAGGEYGYSGGNLLIIANEFAITGSITSNGGIGGDAGAGGVGYVYDADSEGTGGGGGGGGGGGAGGAILIIYAGLTGSVTYTNTGNTGGTAGAGGITSGGNGVAGTAGGTGTVGEYQLSNINTL